jgi:hypothetical protein
MAYVTDKAADPRSVVEMFIAYTLVWAAPKVLEKYLELKYARKDQ